MSRKIGHQWDCVRQRFSLDIYVCAVTHGHMNKSESPSDIIRWLEGQSSGFWPAILGSLSLRRAPCIRENCPACRSGEQHQSWVLYGRVKERRFSVYVPEDLVPEIQRCLDNGRALQEMLFEAAPRYVQALKRARVKSAKKRGK